jgi:hypothetical protein
MEIYKVTLLKYIMSFLIDQGEKKEKVQII